MQTKMCPASQIQNKTYAFFRKISDRLLAYVFKSTYTFKLSLKKKEKKKETDTYYIAYMFVYCILKVSS